jgi:membrane associated rhomboid family serine protease
MGRAIGCSRDELVAQFIVRGPAGIKLIWTPETPQPAFPETVPLLVPAFKRISIKAATSNIWVGLGLIAFGIVLALVTDDWSLLYRNILSIFGALALVEGIWQLIRTSHYTQEDAAADATSLRFDAWIKTRKISGYTFVLAGYLVFVGAIQVISAGGESISRAGLVKPAVWDGQLWRLLTACLMHGNWMHFWMNFLALLHFSKIVEQTRRPSYVPLIFLLSGACGSVFSVLLYPHTTSVGASGGLMGLLGFITVAAYFDKKTYPPKYLRNSIEAIAMIGVFGLIGFAFIDNAAHLGGLVGGLALGYVLVRPYNQRANAQNIEQQVAILGMVALVILGLVASLAIFKMLR